jgi:hypothetical protein
VMPFMYSGMTNYNLYDSLGKGFEFSAVWAHMKANRASLLAVTWRTVAYMSAITLLIFAGMGPYFLFIASVVADPGAVGPNVALGYLGLQAVFALAYPFMMFASFVVNQIVWIMWGRYAREAYQLAESPVQAGGAIQEEQTGEESEAAGGWLPEAPGQPTP